MKTFLRKVFSPLLNIFEQGDEPYMYRSLSRKILIVMGLLFAGIAAFVIAYIIRNDAYGYFAPAIIFSGVALVAIIVGCLGTERAVAKIWGNK
jgi:hypothetical protein